MATIVKCLPPRAGKTLSCGVGSKGERLYERTRFLVREVDAGRCRWLLARRSLAERAEMACFVVSGPRESALPEMVRVAGARWTCEECIQVAKAELGLDQHEIRSRAGS